MSFVGAAVAACAFGCAPTTPEQPREWEPGLAAQARAELLAMRAPPDDLTTPGVRGGTDGLEIVWFLALDHRDSDAPAPDGAQPPANARDDRRITLARALEPYLGESLPIDAAAVARLERNGVRLVRVPLERVAEVERALDRIGPRRREWFGWALDWRPLLTGRSLPPGWTLLIDGVRTRAAAFTSSPRAAETGSTLRLIARCWTAPISGEGPPADPPAGGASALRLELVSQALGAHADARARAEEALGLPLLSGDAAALDARRDGPLLPALSIDAWLPPGYAYILVPETPGVSWTAGARASAPPPAADDSGLVPLEPVGSDSDPFDADMGPDAILPPTIGEAMLMNLSREPHEPAARIVLILIPRVPEPATEGK